MKITIAGCGNMGMIYARAFLKYNIVSAENMLLVEKSESRRDALRNMREGTITLPGDDAIGASDIIILAVKPQDFDSLADELRKTVKPGNVIVSIMAGITMDYIANRLHTSKIVRAMPNSPAEFGMGITGYACSPSLSISEIHKTENLLAATGRTIFFESEEMLNAVTALSGSGPAYFFYIVKSMIEAGVKMGMTESVAASLVKQTMLGSFHLLNNNEKSPDELIKAVASKGGTTEAALQVFDKSEIALNLQKGILAARDRGKELSRR